MGETHSTAKEAKDKEIKEDTILLYKLVHDWARHYQTTIAQLNTLALTFNGVIIVFVLTQFATDPHRPRLFLSVLLLPILMCFIVVAVTSLITKAIRGCFARMSLIEDKLGYYDLRGGDGSTPILPDDLRRSATSRMPHIDVWYGANTIVMMACVLIIAYFYLHEPVPLSTIL